MKHSFGPEYFEQAYGSAYALRNPLRKHRHYLNLLAKFGAQSPLLEIGCAMGLFAGRASADYRVFACDVAPDVVKAAHETLPNVDFFCSALPGLSVTHAQFGTIVCADVLEHVWDVRTSLTALQEVLRPGGMLLATVPVYDSILGPVVRYLDKDPTHVHKEGRRWWLDVLRGAGFHIVHWQGVIRYLLGRRYYLHVSSIFLRPFGSAIIVIAQKPKG